MGALITAKENFHAVSLSGGKDSTCLLLLMIERGLPIDAVIWADTGMEFPEMYGHISKVDEHLYRERGLHITTLRSPKSFEYMMFDEPKQKPSTLENRARLGVPPYGNGWPGIKVRWCTGQLKISGTPNRVGAGRAYFSRSEITWATFTPDAPAWAASSQSPLDSGSA